MTCANWWKVSNFNNVLSWLESREVRRILECDYNWWLQLSINEESRSKTNPWLRSAQCSHYSNHGQVQPTWFHRSLVGRISCVGWKVNAICSSNGQVQISFNNDVIFSLIMTSRTRKTRTGPTHSAYVPLRIGLRIFLFQIFLYYDAFLFNGLSQLFIIELFIDSLAPCSAHARWLTMIYEMTHNE